ncbi:MAG: hypothetical protein ABSG68_11635 [Thermoguttaceae bacterium]|jgi:hypothetical protein
MLTGMTTPKPKLRWFQFSPRTLLVFVTLWAIACSWLAVKKKQARRQREAAAAFEKLGGSVTWSKPSGPAWLRGLLGDDFLRTVLYVDLGNTRLTDADLESLTKLKQLQELGLQKTGITDVGLVNLKELSQLQVLILAGTKATDAGLENLKGLNQLQLLYLDDTNVTDAGTENLNGLDQLQQLRLDGTQITDAGLANLKWLKQLHELSLHRTQITDAGVKKLQQALPNCRIER